ncbi:MAG: hypothetical protein WAL91_01550 [Propionicimonas sp.]
MSIDAWWPRIRQGSRNWLIDNNGDAVPDDLVDEIVRAGGVMSGSYLSDDAVDWVEAVANGETPDSSTLHDERR